MTLKSIRIALLSICFLSVHIAASQSFFTAETISESESYGSVSTRLLESEVAEILKAQDFSFGEWSTFFYLKTSPTTPPIRGTYRLSAGQVVFKPTETPNPELKYIISFSYERLSQVLQRNLSSNATYNDVVSFLPPANNQPKVEGVLPSLDDKTPSNVLRLYVTFSAPMGNENPYDRISIKDETGNKLENPFLVIPEGLWNIDKTRLTLLFNPNKEKDVLEAGKKYTLEISKDWKGASGKALQESYSRSFVTAAPIKEAINVNRWAMTATQDRLGVLTVITDHPLDQPLAQRMLYIQGPDGNILPTRVEFQDRKRLKILWAAQEAETLNLIIDPRLEDICGNTPLGAFDLEAGTQNQGGEQIKLRFKINQ